MKNLIVTLTVCLCVAAAGTAQAGVFFEEEFSGPLTWVTSDASVSVQNGDYLVIGSNGDFSPDEDWAEKEVSVSLSNDYFVVMEQRQKLESGGRNYRLPWNNFWFEDGSGNTVTYLASDPIEDPPSFGWYFGSFEEGAAFAWTHSDEHAVPGDGWWTTATADYWAVTKIVMTPTGGQLYVKPDDEARGWYGDEFYLIASTDWQHTTLTKIGFEQPWDSVCYVDYVRIYDEALPTPEPSTIALLLTAIPGIGFACYRRKKAVG